MEIEASPNPITKQLHLCLVSHGCRRNDGQGRVNYEIVKAALRRGWRVTFIGAYLADDLPTDGLRTDDLRIEELPRAPALQWLKVERSSLPSNLIKNLIFAVKASTLLSRHKNEFDIIHTTGFTVWSRTNINTVHFVHSGWLQNRFYPYWPIYSLYALYQYFFTFLNSHLERHAFKVSGRVIAVSEKVEDEIKHCGVAQEKLSVIHNGVDLEEFHPGPARRADFSLPEGKTLFLFAGDIRSKRKNLDSVLKALSLAPEIHLAVAGALRKSPYPALAETLCVADRVHFLGLVKDMPALMRSVDAFVFPSRYEPFGLVLLEALASGLPVITAATAGGATVIGDGGIVLSNPEDIQQLANAMLLLANDPKLRSEMAGKALAISAGLSWSGMTDQYFEIYDQCLKSQPQASQALYRKAETKFNKSRTAISSGPLE